MPGHGKASAGAHEVGAKPQLPTVRCVVSCMLFLVFFSVQFEWVGARAKFLLPTCQGLESKTVLMAVASLNMLMWLWLKKPPKWLALDFNTCGLPLLFNFEPHPCVAWELTRDIFSDE